MISGSGKFYVVVIIYTVQVALTIITKSVGLINDCKLVYLSEK